MKRFQLLVTFLLVGGIITGQTQEAPKGFSKGRIVLSDGSVMSGYIKEKIRSNASVVLINGDNKKKNYDGSDLRSAEVNNEKFLCIKGDFFRIITDGEMKFLQKASDASSKPVYHGNQAVFINGTAGNPGDYFIYTEAGKQLHHLTRKTTEDVISTAFVNCTEAVGKAKAVGGNIEQLQEAVDIYNKCKNGQH